MKKIAIPFLSLFCLISIPAFSQMKYTSDGKLGIGETSPSSIVNIKGATPILEISNTYQNKAGILFNDFGNKSGEYGKILFNSATGNGLSFFMRSSTAHITLGYNLITTIKTYGVIGSQYNDQGLIFDDSGYGDMSTLRPVIDWAGNLGDTDHEWATLHCDHITYSTLTQQPCDVNLKTNIRTVDDPLVKLKSVRGVQYDISEEFYKDADPKLRQALTEEKKDIYGFIAQELETVFPELVVKNEETGRYGVNTIEMIPILVEAIKAQQYMIDTLNAQISNLLGGKKGIEVSNLSSTLDENPAILYQNVPNPFNEITNIKCAIPYSFSSAHINVYDLQGSQIRSYDVSHNSESDIVIPASELHAGIYIYNLIVDGAEVDIKRMLLTE